MVSGDTGVPETSPIQKCETECTSECGVCEKKVCTETQVDCGPKEKRPTDLCEPDRKCVASNCQCK